MTSPYILRKGVSSLSDLIDGNAAISLLMAAGGKWYYCDPTNGTAGGNARTPQTATNSLLTAYNMTRDGYNDGVIFIAGATAWEPAAMLTWSNNYCHLIGTSPLPGVGNRCRIVGTAANALTVPVTFSGNGCVISNIQINNEYGTGPTGIAIVTGSRNLFQNVFFMMPTCVTAASYSLKLTGDPEENTFIRCTIGQQTLARSAATYGLWFAGTTSTPLRNKFIKCEFLSWSTVTTHVLVKIDAITSECFVNWFEDCLFDNLNGGGVLAAAIVDGAVETHHQIILRGLNDFAGCTAVGNPLTYILAAKRGAYTYGGLMATTAES